MILGREGRIMKRRIFGIKKGKRGVILKETISCVPQVTVRKIPPKKFCPQVQFLPTNVGESKTESEVYIFNGKG